MAGKDGNVYKNEQEGLDINLNSRNMNPGSQTVYETSASLLHARHSHHPLKMPSNISSPDGNRHCRPCGEPNTLNTPSSSSSASLQPIDIQSFNNYYVSPTLPSPYNTPFSASHPVSAFSSPSSSEGSYTFGTPTTSQLTSFENRQSPVFEPLDMSPECQGMFSFEWGHPVPPTSNHNSDFSGTSVGFGELNHALADLSVADYSIHNNIEALHGTVDINGTYWSPAQSVANLPHLLTPSAAYNIASLPPACHLCTLPIPTQSTPIFSVYTVSFINRNRHCVFILTCPSATRPTQDAGIYLYVSSTDLYFHSHPGPVPENLPGCAAKSPVGRIRNDTDPEIWLPTGAGGQGQNWLWTFRDMCRNMRMPPRDTPGWREMFREEDWVASVIDLGKTHGMIMGSE